jgi:hypothetical protein
VIKSKRVRWARHIALIGEMRGGYRVLVGKPEERSHLEDSELEGNVILKWICRKWAWTGFIWLRIETGCEHL